MTPILAVLLTLGPGCGQLRKPVPRTSGPLPHQAYVWQRAWLEPVSQAVTHRGAAFAGVQVLMAEVKWTEAGPELSELVPDYRALAATGKPVGLVLRLGPYHGSFPTAQNWLASLAAALVEKARTNQLVAAEFQVDFDCPESKLENFQGWLSAIRSSLLNTPLTITALPAWLDRPAFARVAAMTDGYVLQVHSLTRPRTFRDPCSLCDPTTAWRAVEQAARLGHPFRVALPTYGYRAVFSADDRCLGISSEGPSLAWPSNARHRKIQADPEAMAGLVRSWTADRPAALTGIIWFRLPLDEDDLNWRWTTLQAVMDGRVPQANLHVNLLQPQPGLIEIQLVNDGQGDQDGPVQVTLNWQGGRVVATEGLAGFEVAGSTNLSWSTTDNHWRLSAGQEQTVGWARIEDATLLQVTLH